MTTTALDILKDALKELGAIGVADTPDADVSTFALGKLNRVIDNFNAEGANISAQQLLSYTLTPSLQPHTIGPSGATWTATAAPVSILGANLILTGGIRYPIAVRDARWWSKLANPTWSASIPTDLRYEPTPWPKGSVYLWPVPSSAYSIELLTSISIAAMVLATTFAMMPGYQDAVTLTLAEELATPLGVQLPPDLLYRATKARARVQANNSRVPPLESDAPTGQGGAWFDYQTGRLR